MASPGDEDRRSPVPGSFVLGTRVEVEWVDHAFHFGAYAPRAQQGLETLTSVGYLVQWDDEVIVLAQSCLLGVPPQLEYHENLHLISGCVVRVSALRRSKLD